MIDDLRGDMANARKDFGAAERYWRLYVAARPKAAQSLEKLADLCAGEERWHDAVEYWTQALALNETAAGRIRGANLYVLALADAQAALELDPSSAGAHFQAAHALDVLGRMKEDHRFHEHTGIDWLATAAACIRDLEAGRVVSGGLDDHAAACENGLRSPAPYLAR